MIRDAAGTAEAFANTFLPHRDDSEVLKSLRYYSDNFERWGQDAEFIDRVCEETFGNQRFDEYLTQNKNCISHLMICRAQE